MKDEVAPLVVEIVKALVSLMRDAKPDWQKAFLRFSYKSTVSEAKVSLVTAAGVEIIDVLKFRDFFHSIGKQGRNLLKALDKDEGLILLVVSSNLEYEIQFEYQNMDRWRISKIGGGTGIPDEF